MEIGVPQSVNQQAFAQHGYLLLPALVNPAVTDFLWSYAHTRFACRFLRTEPEEPHMLFAYGDPAFDGLLEYLRPVIEETSGLQLSPTYSYFRLYTRGAMLKRHRDRPACEVSVSLNIGQVPADAWPLYVQGNVNCYSALLSPGDALLYRGIDLLHWREPFQGSRLIQVFLHYVDRNGPHADQKFDGRETLMRPNAIDATS